MPSPPPNTFGDMEQSQLHQGLVGRGRNVPLACAAQPMVLSPGLDGDGDGKTNSVALQHPHTKEVETCTAKLPKDPPARDPSLQSYSSKSAHRKTGHQSPAAPKRVVGVNEQIRGSSPAFQSPSNAPKTTAKTHPSHIRMARPKTQPSQDSSKLSSGMNLSKQLQQEQLPAQSQGKQHTANAVRKSGGSSPSAAKQVSAAKDKSRPPQTSSTSSKTPQVKEENPSKVPPKSSSETSSHQRPRQQRQRQRRRQKHNSRTYCQEWDHDDNHVIADVVEPLGQNCLLCGNDLVCSPLPVHEKSESNKLPDTAVLPCGHAFHILCLEAILSEEQLKDPLCFVCASPC